jgi:hypothetical protein
MEFSGSRGLLYIKMITLVNRKAQLNKVVDRYFLLILFDEHSHIYAVFQLRHKNGS